MAREVHAYGVTLRASWTLVEISSALVAIVLFSNCVQAGGKNNSIDKLGALEAGRSSKWGESFQPTDLCGRRRVYQLRSSEEGAQACGDELLMTRENSSLVSHAGCGGWRDLPIRRT
jgi:hypothetical protein